MNNFWDNDNVSEYELLEESIEAEQAEPVVYEPEDIDDEVLEEIVEESAFDLDEHQAATVYNARVRLEQANLYEMLINHNLFEGVEASEQAVNNVQNELKYFIVGRLELLLGIRQPKSRVVESQFGDDEIDFIKALAAKGMAMQGRQPSAPAPKPVTPPAKTGLKPLTQKKRQTVPEPTRRSVQKKIEQAKKEVEEQPLPTKPKTTRKRRTTTKKAAPKKKNEPKISSGGAVKRQMTEAEAEELARRDLQKLAERKKPFHKMTKKEKAAEVKRVNEENARKAPPKEAIPMASFEQQQMKYMTEQQSRSATGNDFHKFNSVLANALAMKKAQEGE